MMQQVAGKTNIFNRRTALAALFVVLLLCGAERARAQHYLGVRVGYGSGTARFYPKVEMGSVWGLYSGGVSWKYFTKERYAGGVEVDLLFMQQGYKMMDYNRNEDLRYERVVNSIVLPVFWQPHAYLFRRRMRVFLNLGINISYNMSSEYKIVSKTSGVIEEGDYTMKLSRDNPLGYGLVGGGGVGWSTGRLEIFSEVRYYVGYGDILRNKNKYEGNPLRSPMDGLQISIGAYYRLGKGGILAQPSKRVAAKLQDIEERLRQAEGEAASADGNVSAAADEMSRGELRRMRRELKRMETEGVAPAGQQGAESAEGGQQPENPEEPENGQAAATGAAEGGNGAPEGNRGGEQNPEGQGGGEAGRQGAEKGSGEPEGQVAGQAGQ